MHDRIVTTGDWGGAERTFALRLGEILALEEACKIGIGAIYLRVVQHAYTIDDVRHTIRLGLIGGGMAAREAKETVERYFDATPLHERHTLAGQILLDLMNGVPPAKEKASSVALEEPQEAGAILAWFADKGIPPQDARAMSYADFVAIMHAQKGKDVQPPTEDEFNDMVRRLAPHLAEGHA